MAAIKEEHLAADWRRWLEAHRLDDFDAWWQLPLDGVDRANRAGRGWSVVSAFEADGVRFFVKRQSDYLRRRHALRLFAIPTARVEHRMIGWYQRSGIPALRDVYFGWRSHGGEEQAVLVTEALSGFASLREIATARARLTPAQRRALCRSVGRAIARLHRSGRCHGGLYPKHVFARWAGDEWQVRFIDLENTRRHFGRTRAKLADLESLSRHARGFSLSDELRVLLAYLGKVRVDASVRAAALRIRAGTRAKRGHRRRRRTGG